MPGYTALSDQSVSTIETKLDAINQHLSPLKEFILPGGSRPAALCHQARAVCRRAERCIVLLEQNEQISELSRKYLNKYYGEIFVADSKYVEYLADTKKNVHAQKFLESKLKKNWRV
mgnify:CR=1 FL=1